MAMDAAGAYGQFGQTAAVGGGAVACLQQRADSSGGAGAPTPGYSCMAPRPPAYDHLGLGYAPARASPHCSPTHPAYHIAGHQYNTGHTSSTGTYDHHVTFLFICWGKSRFARHIASLMTIAPVEIP